MKAFFYTYCLSRNERKKIIDAFFWLGFFKFEPVERDSLMKELNRGVLNKSEFQSP